jgi:N-acyl-D-aspartate/D-glutamate deacylase
MRENYPVDEPRLSQLAMVSNYRDTWAEGADYSDILQAVEEIGEESQVVERDFEFAMPDGQIYTQWSDFVSDEARNAMKEYVAALKDHETTRTALEQLRRRYAQGATELNDMILRMEEKLRDDRELLRSLSNDVVRLEQNN